MRFFRRPVRIFGPCRSPRIQIGFAFFRGDFADHFDQFEFLRLGSMGKIQPGNIETGTYQFAKSCFIARRRP